MPHLQTLWRETRGFVRRESKLLLPLALATMATGYAAYFLGFGIVTRQGLSAALAVLMLSAGALVVLGQLAITALALKPGMSVGESMRAATLAFPRMALIGIILLLLLLIASIPLSIALALAGIDPAAATRPGQGMAQIVAAPLLGFMLVITARLFVIQPVVIDQKTSVIQMCQTTFRLTRGATLPLLAINIFTVMCALLAQLIAGTITSGIFTIVESLLGAPFIASVMVALAAGMANAVVSLFATVFAALYYQARSAEPPLG